VHSEPSPLPGSVRPACAEKDAVNSMVKTNRKVLTDLLIVSSLSKQKRLIESLSLQGEQAYLERNYARLENIGERLINLSPRSEGVGRYYSALADSRQWKISRIEAMTEFESLCDYPSIRSSAFVAIAGAQIASGKANTGTKLTVLEATRIAMKSQDFLTFINAQSILSVLASINGDHKKSLDILRGLQPIVDNLSSIHGAIKLDFYNSVAYEKLQTGDVKAASYFIRPLLNSRYLSAYPEWQETAVEIAQSIPPKNQPRIFVPYRKPDNVVDHEEFQAMQAKAEAAKAQKEPAQIEQENYEYPCIVVHINNYKFAIVHLSENRGIAGKTIQIYGMSLEELTSRWGDKGTLLIKSFFCHKKEVRLLSEDKILPAHLSHLYGLLEDLAMLPESLFYDTIDNKRADDEEVNRIWDYVAPMLEGNMK
jgi:hypothetical protein